MQICAGRTKWRKTKELYFADKLTQSSSETSTPRGLKKSLTAFSNPITAADLDDDGDSPTGPKPAAKSSCVCKNPLTVSDDAAAGDVDEMRASGSSPRGQKEDGNTSLLGGAD